MRPHSGPYSEATMGGVVFEEEVEVKEEGKSQEEEDKGASCGYKKMKGSFTRAIRGTDKQQQFACTVWRPDVKPR